ncbi:MAG: peptide ABC transporter permease [Paracoccaceae bacterium]|nr:MAG: DMT family transporter [Alphaproteobacteria bacterium]GIX12498.1 MAG: peptide ABC transporter permease [Paracoccaceae bacterium]
MDLRAIIAGLAFAFMWSSAFTSARIVVAAAPPLAALSVRFLISGLIAVAIARWLGQPLRLARREWVAVALFGLCQNALYLGLNFVAMQWVEASVAAIVASTLPLWVAAASRVIFSERLSALGIGGLVAGFLGVVVIMSGRMQSSGIDALGLGLVVAGVLSLAAATLLLRDSLPRRDAMMVVGLQMLVGSLCLAPPALIFESWQVRWSVPLILAFAYTTLVPGLLATLVWFWLVRRIGPTRAATFHFLNPFLGVAIAAAILGEALGPRDLLGAAVVAGGILAVQMGRRPRAGGLTARAGLAEAEGAGSGGGESR